MKENQPALIQVNTKNQEAVAIYCRVSTKEQKDNQNITNQTHAIQKYVDSRNADDNSIMVFDWYLDDGVSGTIPVEERPEGSRLLSDAKDRKFSIVLVWKLDRLARKPYITLDTIETLKRNGISVISITEGFDASTITGRLMLSMLAGFAGFERDNIVERSIEGTNRRAKEGQWLGGIVPYGYLVQGKKKDARLIVSSNIIQGLALSESDVVRMIYKKLAYEKISCIKIANELNALGIPPMYTRDCRLLQKTLAEGKRKVRTAGVWRPSRIRNMVVNTVYKGNHVYGKRSLKQRELISRPVPAIVSEQDWDKAQQTLISNRILSACNANEKYLLRGLVKCDLCGLTYVGCTSPNYHGGKKRYYRCNGKTSYRGPLQGKCQSKAIKADTLEEGVWKTIEKILLEADTTVEKLNFTYLNEEKRTVVIETEMTLIEKSILTKECEKERMLDLYRHQLILIADLENQLSKIANERSLLEIRLKELQTNARDQEHIEEKVRNAGNMIRSLQDIFNGPPLSWEIKRRVIELLIWEVKVNTIVENNKKRTQINITFAFGKEMLAVNRTGKDSSPRPA